jgi:preprotein translocase subunit SecA
MSHIITRVTRVTRHPQDLHYTVDEKQRNVLLTEDGYEAVEDVLQV